MASTSARSCARPGSWPRSGRRCRRRFSSSRGDDVVGPNVMNYYWCPGPARGSFQRRGGLVIGEPPALRHATGLGRSRGSWRPGTERESVARSARMLLLLLTASTRVRNCDARESSRSDSPIIIPSRPGTAKALSRRLVASRSRALLELEQSTGTPRGGAVRARATTAPSSRWGEISLRRRPLEGRCKRSYWAPAVASGCVAGRFTRPARHKK